MVTVLDYKRRVALVEDGRQIVNVYANASARDAAIPNPSNGLMVYNQQLDAEEIYDSSVGVWKSNVDLWNRGIVPDWCWDFRNSGVGDGVEITTMESWGLQSAAAAVPLSGDTGPTMDRDGVWGGRAGLFNGNDNLAVDDLAHNLTELTVSVFIATASDGWAFNCPISHYDAGVNQKSWLILMTTGKGARFYLSDDGTNTDKEYRMSDGVLSDDTLHHLAFTFDNGSLVTYLDGVEASVTKASDGAMTALHDSTAKIGIGTRLNNGARDATLNNSHVLVSAIFNRALSADQMAQWHSYQMSRQK